MGRDPRDARSTVSAPALIYRDSDLIKRAIRDLYNREIDEVIVEGEDGYKAARGFMKLLMPSHVRRVKHYADPMPLFQRYGVEDQLSAMYQPVVQLKSGGYLVINPTEALVSIDINSGRSTREHNIEQTAFAPTSRRRTRSPASCACATWPASSSSTSSTWNRSSHVRKVEKAMKEALKNDRARIQVGRISSFGLMEMSRQRLRTGVLEASTKACPHCEGTGLMRTASSAGLSALRMIEDEAARGRGDEDPACAPAAKRRSTCSTRSAPSSPRSRSATACRSRSLIDESFEGARMTVESSGPRPVAAPRSQPERTPIEEDLDEIEALEEDVDEEEEPEEREERTARREREEGEGPGRRRRRRRRGGRGRRREGEAPAADEEAAPIADQNVEQEAPGGPEAGTGEEEAAPAKRRRRRRRGKPAEQRKLQAC